MEEKRSSNSELEHEKYFTSWVHGVLSGLICTGQPLLDHLDFIRRQESLTSINQSQVVDLEKLYQETQKKISGQDMDFTLCLPEDEETLKDRVVAFSQWCNGFLQGWERGVQYNTEIDDSEYSIQEIIKDLTDFTQVDEENLEENEENEQAYMELVEYLRAAVMMLYTDSQMITNE